MIALSGDRITLYKIKINTSPPARAVASGHYSQVQIRIGALARGRRDGEYYCVLIAQVMHTRVSS